ncbi:MAG: hypothetical protein QM784_05810 [Polyangiaceae bacterium]
MLAGQQLAQSGEVEAGRELLREILAAARVVVPQGRVVLTMALLAKRVALRLRIRAGVTPVRETDPHELRLLDALWSLSSSLALVDTIGAAYYETLFLGYAIERGDSRALARALSLEAVYSSIEGGNATTRVTQLISALEHACEVSGELDTRALLDMAKSIVAWMSGDFETCLRCATSAEALLARHGRGLAFEFRNHSGVCLGFLHLAWDVRRARGAISSALRRCATSKRRANRDESRAPRPCPRTLARSRRARHRGRRGRRSSGTVAT